jgi:antitoxin VapB
MSISIRNPRVELLAREVAREYNITMTQAIIDALEEKKRRINHSDASENVRCRKILQLAMECSNLPDLDTRSPDEILGYDDNGVI